MRALAAALATLALGWGSGASAGCAGQEAPCQVAAGTYHIVLPEGDKPRGAIMFLHGWGSSGTGSLRMKGMVDAFTRAGFAVIAPDGTPREGRSGLRWSFHPDWPPDRDDHAFLKDVKADAARRFGFEPGRVLLSGFSVGGSMVSYLACADPGAFMAYAPLAGGLWRPHPEACAGPVRLFHTHGWSDGTVPIEGRAVGGTNAREPDAFVQGDVFETFETWRLANGCSTHMPQKRWVDGIYWRRSWTSCAPGSALEMALHPGGHAISKGWAAMTLDWFEGQLLSD